MTAVRALRIAALAATLTAGSLVGASPALASFHLMKIVEVYAGSPEAPAAQFVELQMYASGQNRVTGHTVKLYDAAGVERSSTAFPAAVASGASQATLLAATSEAAALFGLTPDLTIPSSLSAAGGKACFDALDCVSWGSYSGSAGSSGTATGVPFGVPEGIVGGTSIRRDIAAGNATLLEAADDTGSSAADFDAAVPSPRTNAGVTGVAPGGVLALAAPLAASVPEAGSALVRVTRTGGSGTVSAVVSTVDGTATAPADYTATSMTVTFAPGETEQTVSVPVVDDAVDETDETFGLRLRQPTGSAVLGSHDGSRTITDDDLTVSVTPDTAVQEGSGDALVTLMVTLSSPSPSPVTVDATTVDGTATAASGDYDAVGTTVSFAAGETSKPLTVLVRADAADEDTESFTVALSAPSGATLGDPSATVTVLDDPADATSATVSVGDATVLEGGSGTAALTFPVSLSQPVGGDVSVTWSTSDGTGVAGSDYVASSGTAVVPAGSTTATLAVPVFGDPTVEPDETVTVTLGSATGATVVDGSGTGTVVNDDSALSVADVTVLEGSSGSMTATVTVRRAGVATTAATVKVATVAGTATATTDFTTLASTTLTFAAGQTERLVPIAVRPDTAPEAHEAFTVKLSTPSAGLQISDDLATVVVTDDDLGTPAAFQIDDAAVVEGPDGGTTVAGFTVTRTGDTSQAVSVKVTTAAATSPFLPSATTTTDFSAVPSTLLSFAAGETTKPVSVTVKGDATSEPDEFFFVTLATPVGAVVADARGVGTIRTDDGTVGPAAATAFLRVADTRLDEGNTGSTDATVTIARSGDLSAASSVKVTVAASTATAPADFTLPAAVTVTLAAGVASRDVVVAVVGDTVPEMHEAFLVKLSTPSAGTAVLDDSATVVITDEDAGALATLTAVDASVVEGDGAARTVLVTLSRSGDLSEVVTVKAASALATSPFVPAATVGADYTALASTVVTFGAGVATQSVSVTVAADDLNEASEFLFVTLTTATRATITDARSVVTLLDDDPMVT